MEDEAAYRAYIEQMWAEAMEIYRSGRFKDVYKRQVTDIAAVLSRSSMTVKRSLNELETAGLIMRVRQGVGEPNRIYVLIPGKEDAALA